MEEDEQFVLVDVPDISWEVLQQAVETTTLTHDGLERQGLSPINGVLLCFFVLLVLCFLVTQIVIYYRYWMKRRSNIPRLSRRFRSTKTITFQSRRPIVRAHVFDPTHHIPPSRPLAYSSRSIHGRPRTISSGSDATHSHNGHSTVGTQSRSSFASTVFMLDSKSNYTSRVSASPEMTLDIESESGSQWSDGTMGRYSLSSAFFPCENPAFETDSTTSISSSVSSQRSRSFKSSSSGSTLYRPHVYRTRLPNGVVKRLHSGQASSSTTSSSGDERYQLRRALRGRHCQAGLSVRSGDSSLTSVSSMSGLNSFRLKKSRGPSRTVKWARHS